MTDTLAGIDLDDLLRELGDVAPGDEYRTAREWATLLRVGEAKAKAPWLCGTRGVHCGDS